MPKVYDPNYEYQEKLTTNEMLQRRWEIKWIDDDLYITVEGVRADNKWLFGWPYPVVQMKDRQLMQHFVDLHNKWLDDVEYNDPSKMFE